MSELHLEPGDLLDGRFRILRELGRGGFSWIGEVEVEGEVRALKLLQPRLERAQLTKAQTRFAQEAGMCQRLSHPNIVKIFEYGQLEAHPDVSYMILERIPGQPVRDRLDAERILSPDRVVVFAKAVASALAHAHAHGIIHRDIKPLNVMWGDDTAESVRLLDFGVAKDLEEDLSITDPNSMVGSPGYMAPEQLKNTGVDARTDLYLLGLVLYEMLCGRPPFERTNSAIVVIQRAKEEVPPFYERNDEVVVPPDLGAIVLKCLRNQPEERFSSARELLTALEELHPPSTEEFARLSPGGHVKFRTQCLSQALTALFAGAVLLLFPNPLVSLCGITLTPDTEVLSRLAGGMLFALGATLWATADVLEIRTQKRIAVGNAAIDAIMGVFFAVYASVGVLNAFGYLLAVLFSINTVTWMLSLRQPHEVDE